MSRLSTSSHHITLGYLGLVPFLLFTGGYFIAETDWLLQAFIFYSISIVSFVAGSMWQPSTHPQSSQDSTQQEQTQGQAWLVVLVTLAMPVLVFAPTWAQLAYLAAAYVWLLVLERSLLSWQSLSADYQKMRGKITAVVLVCHLFMLALVAHIPVS
ncbi:DUF3429 domain-containing protein [Motilimonas eburnea]|uniref:DUF3429 domain-containing protein n=1 Tax=Motilimonas eburnea TaxID=1737488 RepID=UPI001E4E25EA|nr:DUF3429 domain-containing protein [Motilimonas eburnea]MCE2573424.1 DUF3429 domain-containing protein [Motilimonas eburnea]